MILTGQSVPEIADRLAGAQAAGEKVEATDLAPLNRLIQHTPEDMTVTVEAGMTLGVLGDLLGRHGQWLPVDPPRAEALRVGEVISRNLSGPRRYGYGTIREHLIGLTVVLADGRVVKSGGRVVKNVAGYDLCKLFVGHRGTLGVIVEATFKLRPKPETEVFVRCRPGSPKELLDAFLEARRAALDPVVLDLDGVEDSSAPSLVMGFAGSREAVAWQQETAAGLAFAEPASLDHEERFWSLPEDPAPRWFSVPPSQVLHSIPPVQHSPWVARAGNGLVWHRSGLEPGPVRLPDALHHRMKTIFDPRGILPPLPW